MVMKEEQKEQYSRLRLYTPIADKDYSRIIASTNPDLRWRKMEDVMNKKKREMLEAE